MFVGFESVTTNTQEGGFSTMQETVLTTESVFLPDLVCKGDIGEIFCFFRIKPFVQKFRSRRQNAQSLTHRPHLEQKNGNFIEIQFLLLDN